MTTPRLPRDDLAAAMAARRELGPDYDDAFVETVVERLQESMEIRKAPAAKPRPAREGGGQKMSVTIVSLVVAIPLTAIAAGTSGIPGLLIAWAGLVLINVAYALRPRA